jgi:hypothetical protein
MDNTHLSLAGLEHRKMTQTAARLTSEPFGAHYLECALLEEINQLKTQLDACRHQPVRQGEPSPWELRDKICRREQLLVSIRASMNH